MSGTVTAFLEDRQIASGDRESVTRLLEERYPGDHSAILVFDDESGRVTDLDYWDAMKLAAARRPGRPKMGVRPREVTLLPGHWEWLSKQPGGASAALRRLVEAAIDSGGAAASRRDAAYNAMQALCGDRPHYEEALRALYRDDGDRFAALTAEWPADIRAYVERIRSGGTESEAA